MPVKILIFDENERHTAAASHFTVEDADIVVKRRLRYEYEIIKDRHGDADLWVDGLAKQPETHDHRLDRV